ncbi:MFS general substrate transporter [Cladorrhinum sp. PSN259]|nr:MFS general substrate transporter [Cladorrhinum sp. PSN259]
MALPSSPSSLTDFLAPLSIDANTVFSLSQKFTSAFRKLAAGSETQFLPTPITESILRAFSSRSSTIQNHGRGGTNLRLAFVQPSSPSSSGSNRRPTLQNHTSHPFPAHLKSSPELLFSWIGSHIADMIISSSPQESISGSGDQDDQTTIPIGIAFSFPMAQTSLSTARIMQMGKGFLSSSSGSTDLGRLLKAGYEVHRTQKGIMPGIEVVAILNDAVATYVTAGSMYGGGGAEEKKKKAVMGLIVGTGCNATVPVGVELLGGKMGVVETREGEGEEGEKVVVNTEWSINGTLAPLREERLITRWDEELDREGEVPGFQPLEYMTGGRYLGELVRLVYVDWMGAKGEEVPERFRTRYEVTSDELSRGRELTKEVEEIVLAVQRRAAGIVAAATVGLLRFAGELPPQDNQGEEELVVGYTGGCIEHFQNYLGDTQRFIDEILEMEYGIDGRVRVVLRPCHDGGIIGAGVLADGHYHDHATAASSSSATNTPVSNEEGSPIEANEFDLMLSRSLPSSSFCALDAEPVEYSMLRNTSRSRRPSRPTRRQQRKASSGVSPFSGGRRASSTSKIPTAITDEETPLLSPPSPSESSNQDGLPQDQGGHQFLSGLTPARFWLLFSQILITYFVACFDGTIMASSHPVITSYFGSSNAASWLSTAFLLTSTSFQPLVGGLSDSIGRKNPYLLMTFIFMLATVWCALAQSMTSFIMARAACGLGAGGMMTLASIIISDVVPIEIRGTYQSYINITYGVGAMSGAALGGAMADYLGWRWEFGVQVPIILACLVIAAWVVPADLGLHGKKRQTLGEAMRTFDFKGSALMSSSVTALILGLSMGGNIYPWSHPVVVFSLSFFAVFFPVFLWVETRAVKPIMPVHLIVKSPHLNLIFGNHIAAFLSNAVLFNVPLFFQGVLLTSATTSGFRLVICSAVASVCGTATGFLITWSRHMKWSLVMGAACTLTGTIVLSSMQRGWPALIYMLCLVPTASGQGFQFPGTFISILAVSEQQKQAVVTSTLVLWRSLGQVLGVSVSSLVLQNALWHYLQIFVEGPDKEQIVEVARKSVEAIRKLDPVYREQVVQGYEAALRVTFLSCSVLALINLLLVAAVKLPKLGSKKK